MTWMEWYSHLAKPSWTPPPWSISLIWTILYPIIAVSFGYVFVQVGRGKWNGRIALPFVVNLIANLLFMPLFSGLRNIPLATVDILVVWASLIWCIVAVWPTARWVAAAQVPYLVWLTIATTVQLSIAVMNPGA